jgi:hypothetical protein
MTAVVTEPYKPLVIPESIERFLSVELEPGYGSGQPTAKTPPSRERPGGLGLSGRRNREWIVGRDRLFFGTPTGRHPVLLVSEAASSRPTCRRRSGEAVRGGGDRAAPAQSGSATPNGGASPMPGHRPGI